MRKLINESGSGEISIQFQQPVRVFAMRLTANDPTGEGDQIRVDGLHPLGTFTDVAQLQGFNSENVPGRGLSRVYDFMFDKVTSDGLTVVYPGAVSISLSYEPLSEQPR